MFRIFCEVLAGCILIPSIIMTIILFSFGVPSSPVIPIVVGTVSGIFWSVGYITYNLERIMKVMDEVMK